jgi:hypothetical protein
MKRAIKSVRAAEAFGRTRLSYSFFMRDFLHSEIAAIEGMANLPDDPEVAIAAGRRLCENLLEPLQDTSAARGERFRVQISPQLLLQRKVAPREALEATPLND